MSSPILFNKMNTIYGPHSTEKCYLFQKPFFEKHDFSLEWPSLSFLAQIWGILEVLGQNVTISVAQWKSAHLRRV